VSGKVYSKNGVTVRPNAQIKVWHLSPESSKYNHMGAFSANESGAYAFKTDMPNRTTGKLPRIYFKISHGGNVVYTELIVDANRAYISHEHWENHKSLNDNLFPVYKKNLVETEIQFNVTV
jgi:protocatechuate 3,4-dioxygenase beta subunit